MFHATAMQLCPQGMTSSQPTRGIFRATLQGSHVAVEDMLVVVMLLDVIVEELVSVAVSLFVQ